MKKQPLKEAGLSVMSLQAAGGVANDGVEFILNDYIKIHSIFVSGAFCYLFFPELSSARNSNSIFSSVTTLVGASVGTVNQGFSRFAQSTNNYIYLDKPLIVKTIQLYQGTASAAFVTIYYENYKI